MTSLGPHRRIVAGVAGLAALVVVAATVDFGRRSFFEALAIPILAGAAFAALWIIARHLDRSTPAAPATDAFLRMLLPSLLAIGFSWWAMNQAIFDNTQLGWFITMPAVVGMVGLAYLSTKVGSRARRASPSPTTKGENAGESTGFRWIHTMTSTVFTLAWLPLGFIFLLLSNWCPPRGEGTKLLVLSLGFVLLQLLGNVIAGPLLDRRFGREGGLGLCIGRSVFVAIALVLVASGLYLGLDAIVGPHGPTPNCS